MAQNTPNENYESSLLDRKPLKEEIFDILHKRIISGKYAPGEWLRQEDISTQLGVSQTPVREALDLLASSGIAERIPFRGVRVIKLTTEEIVDAYAMRLFLESKAVAISALVCTQNDIACLYEIVKRTETLISLNDMSAQMQVNREFHHSIVSAARNMLLTKLFDTVSHQFPDWMLYEYMFRHPELLQPSLTKELTEHKAIVDAIAARNPEKAAHEVTTHIKNLGQELVANLNISNTLMSEKEKQMMDTINI